MCTCVVWISEIKRGTRESQRQKVGAKEKDNERKRKTRKEKTREPKEEEEVEDEQGTKLISQ